MLIVKLLGFGFVMSRAFRNNRKFRYLIEDHAANKVRDGAVQYAANSCRHHGGCPWCEGNRTFKNKRRMRLDVCD